MHLIKLVACKTLQSFQSGFYAQSNFQKKERFLASFLMGTFGDAGRSMFRPFGGPRFGARKSHENRLRAEVPSQLDYLRLLYRQVHIYPVACCQKRYRGDSHAPRCSKVTKMIF